MRPSKSAYLLLMPVGLVLGAFFLVPLALLLYTSFNTHAPGTFALATTYEFTWANYSRLLGPPFTRYLWLTFKLSVIASALGLALGYPLAYLIARRRSDWVRTALLGFLIAMLFLSVIVRLYGIGLAFLSMPALRAVVEAIGVPFASSTMSEIMIVTGLLHVTIPIVTLTLVGSVQNVNPMLEEAARVLGASRWFSVLSITVRLSIRGLISGFLLAFTLSMAAFVIPLILGRGNVLFVSNLVYNRFSQIVNYPSAAAMSVVLMIMGLVAIFAVARVSNPRWQR